MASGRVQAKIEPLGPTVQASTPEEAVQAARRAHQAYLRQQTRFLPPGVPCDAVEYRVVGAASRLAGGK